ncbi:MAG: hypothetical protein Q9163_004081 [Psora crenata]
MSHWTFKTRGRVYQCLKSPGCFLDKTALFRCYSSKPIADVRRGLLTNSRLRFPEVKAPWRANRSHGQEKALTTVQTRDGATVCHPRIEFPAYQPPKKGVLSFLPGPWIPYAELMRLDKPAGTYYLFFPCLFSTLLAACYTGSTFLPVLTTSTLFFTGALIMRGAGCTINDWWDRNFDPQVARTRLRPIARGAVTPLQALTFAGFQCLAGLGVLLQFPTSCLYYGIPSLLLVTTYPLAKRITHYPQFVLGLTFSWGAIMGFPALGVDLIADPAAMKAVTALYASCVSWTVLYDMIYAHMDIKDDMKVGIKSIALRHEKDTKAVLSGLALVQTGLLAAVGTAVGAGPIYFVGSCGSAAVTLGLMIWKVNLKAVGNCWWWFKNGVWYTGGGIASGLLAEYLFGDYVDTGAA